MESALHTRVPLPVVVLVATALTVLGAILAQFVMGLIIGLIKLVLILVAFVGIGLVGLYLWRRGDMSDLRRYR
jgi:hypothetical protein